MKIKYPNSKYANYVYVVVALLISFWTISLAAVLGANVELNLTTTLLNKFIEDCFLVFIFSIISFLFYWLFQRFLKEKSYIFFIIFSSVLLLIEIGLSKYTAATLLNLGADILGYSYNDMYITVTASESFSFLYILPFVFFPICFFCFVFIIKKYIAYQKVSLSLYALFFISIIIKLLFGNQNPTPFSQNKIAFLVTDIVKFQNEKIKLSSLDNEIKNEYPLLKASNKTKDVLSPFFTLNKEKPNIVVIIVEGLGSEFMTNNAYSGFTPYLDFLVEDSMYWQNFVSTTGRTFGALPSLLGSLPFGEKGFSELTEMPGHISLISVLKSYGYTTSYYSGDKSSFDKKINFLEYNGIDNVIDESKFGKGYVKTAGNSGGFSWGYPDAEIFKKTLASLDAKSKPRLDIIMTLSNHEPFNFPSKEIFKKRVDSMLVSETNLKASKEDVALHKDIFATLLYTDTAIKNFIEAYKKRDDYKNTIFVITGDHRLIPINQKDKLCRYHVPLLIHSPMIKRAEKFKSISSHWDVTPSLVALLNKNYGFTSLQKTAWMGTGLDTARFFRNIHKIPMMRYKGSVNDFIYKEYLYSDGDLYKIKENFGTYKVNEEEKLNMLYDSLLEFKKLNAYVTTHNKIYPDSLNIYTKPELKFSEKEMAYIKTQIKDLNYDEIFVIAKDKAFNRERVNARLLCNYILKELPNHADAQTLKGRTLAWDGSYIEAENEFLETIRRSPYHEDSYLALLDLYWWSGQDEKSIAHFDNAVKNEIKSDALNFKMAKAYFRMNNIEKATKLADAILKNDPTNKEYITFKTSLK